MRRWTQRLLAAALAFSLFTVCCSDALVEELDDRIKKLEEQVSVLSDDVALLKNALRASQHDEHAAAPEGKVDGPSHTRQGSDFPRHYKIRQKPYERTMFDLSVSFDVYSGGDTYLGEFRQSLPHVRIFWDEMNFYNNKGRWVGQLYFTFWRFLWNFPNLFYGVRECYLRDPRGGFLLRGEEERLLKLISRAEAPGIEFTTSNGEHYRSRKTNNVPGAQRWEVVDETSHNKVAEIQESIVLDVFGRKYSGWTVDILEPTLVDNRIPGYLAAFDLAEQMDSLPVYFSYIFGFVTCLVIPYWFIIR